MKPLRATYRLQLHAGFPLAAVRERVPYLARLGVSHLHLSPLLASRPGSPHGYDVVDPTRLDPELGGEEELEALAAELAGRDMGLVADLVPNHMAASPENPFWTDVLTHGPASRYARWFDVEGLQRPLPGGRGGPRVMLPILGAPLARVLARGELALVAGPRGLEIAYHERRLPLDPATLPGLLAAAARELGVAVDPEAEHRPRWSACLAALARLPSRARRDEAARQRRDEIARAAGAELAGLLERSPALRGALARLAAASRGHPNAPHFLHRVLRRQAYRLAWWRRGTRVLNYRRFFDVDELVALRVEDPEVFAATHAKMLEWIERGWIDGLRIDHIDGLFDPRGYLEALRATVGERLSRKGQERGERFAIWVEKILERGELLRAAWPVEGTTGYDFMAQAEALFLSPPGVAAIEEAYARRTGVHDSADAVALRSKRLVLGALLEADVRRLQRALEPIAARDPQAVSLSRRELRAAWVELVVHLAVYRTYVDERAGFDAIDRAYLESALARALAAGRAREAALLWIAQVISALPDGPERAERLAFVRRTEQVSGPAMAKGVEDTAFYVRVPLLSRNEVGSDPGAPLDAAERDFHAASSERARRWPRALLAVSTHDTKRSADVRARLDALSTRPEAWCAFFDRWRARHRPLRRPFGRGGRRTSPDANAEWALMQTLLGAWPVRAGRSGPPPAAELEELRARVEAATRKAAREAKRHTSWLEPNQEYEAGLASFLRSVLEPAADGRATPFVLELDALARELASDAARIGLARTVLALASPGVPDIYQGDELWNLALVDPDNRRPVDFERRRAELDALESEADGGRCDDDRAKLRWTRELLRERQRDPELFRLGDYRPLEARGEAADGVLAFARTRGERGLLVAVERTPARSFGDTELDLPRDFVRLEPWLGGGSAPLPRETRTVSTDTLLGRAPAAVWRLAGRAVSRRASPAGSPGPPASSRSDRLRPR